jgi:hypothetical protein
MKGLSHPNLERLYEIGDTLRVLPFTMSFCLSTGTLERA